MKNDIIIRALKTFIQAFLGAVTIDGFANITDFDGLKKVLIATAVAGVSAGISAVWNMIVKLSKFEV